jgi:DNA sulfur modification protein DndB
MDINQNQKAVSPNLRLILEEDLYWDSDRADSRIKALRSSIIKELSGSINGPLYNKISIGEDPAELTFKPFADALIRSGLLPSAKGNHYNADSCVSCLYNTNNQNHSAEMIRSKKNIVKFINLCYGFVEEDFYEIFSSKRSFIITNRGTYAFINLLGSLNAFETANGSIDIKSTPLERFDAIRKYLVALFKDLQTLDSKEKEKILGDYGTGAEITWLRFFQTRVNKHFKQYEPIELIDWNERQDENLQDEGRKYSKKLKHL